MLARPALRLHRALSYDVLRGAAASSGRAPTRRPRAPSGSTPTARFNTDPDYCETYGQDLTTGAPADASRSTGRRSPHGRAFLHAAEYEPPPEAPDDEYPLLLTTGRTVYHFHTRTKTGRAPELAGGRARRVGRAQRGGRRGAAASPRATSCASRRRAGRSRRPRADRRHPRGRRVRPVPLRLLGRPTAGRRHRAARANELTMTAWDPVSKQPMFKVAAVGSRCERGRAPCTSPTTSGLLHRARDQAGATRSARSAAAHARRTRRRDHLRAARAAVRPARRPAGAVRPALRRGGADEPDGSALRAVPAARATGGIGLLRDLHDLYLMAAECDIAWTLVGQAAQGAARRASCSRSCSGCEERDRDAARVAARTRMKEAAPQALVVAR